LYIVATGQQDDAIRASLNRMPIGTSATFPGLLVRFKDLHIPSAKAYWIKNAKTPACFIGEKLEGQPDDDGSLLIDVLIFESRVGAIRPVGSTPDSAVPCVDLQGRHVWPGLVDMHTHINTCHLIPRAVNCDGSWIGARQSLSEDFRYWTEEDIRTRMSFALRCAYVHGASAVRTHLQSRVPIAETIWRAFRDVRDQWAGRIELQGVSLVPIEDYGGSYGEQLANLVADSGGVLGGITRPTTASQLGMTEGLDELLDTLFLLAKERAIDIDLHVDETGEPDSVALSRVALAATRHRFKGRLVCGHCCSLALQTEDILAPTLGMCADAGLAVVTMPVVNMYLQDRMPGRTPRWRGVTVVQELLGAGIKVALASDNCRDPFFAYGDHDMIETLRDSVKILHIDHPLHGAPAMVGPVPADLIRASGAGMLRANAPARLIIFNARTLNELLSRPQADRLTIDHGRQVTMELPDYSELDEVNMQIERRSVGGRTLYPEICGKVST
jgi:cytosine/creatinine deaminase